MRRRRNDSPDLSPPRSGLNRDSDQSPPRKEQIVTQTSHPLGNVQIVIRISRHQENKTGLKEEILEGKVGNKEDKMNMKKECQVVSATNLPLLINVKSPA